MKERIDIRDLTKIFKLLFLHEIRRSLSNDVWEYICRNNGISALFSKSLAEKLAFLE